MKITKETNLRKHFVTAHFLCGDKPYHPDFPYMLYNKDFPKNLEFKAINIWEGEGNYLVDRIHTISPWVYEKYKEYFDNIGAKPVDCSTGRYKVSVTIPERKEGSFDCAMWLITQQPYNEEKIKCEIDVGEWIVRKRKTWLFKIPIPGTLISYFQNGVILPGRMIGEKSVISKKQFEECKGKFEFFLLITKVGIIINSKDDTFVTDDVEVQNAIRTCKFELIVNAGVLRKPDKDKSHSMIIDEIEIPV